MTLDEAKRRLQGTGLEITEEKRLGNGTGTQLKINTGAVVNVYDKGTYYVQGRNKEQVESILAGAIAAPTTASGAPPDVYVAPDPDAAISTSSQAERKRIFVVHGHDDSAREQLERCLLLLGLDPFVLANTGGGGLTIIEALENEIRPDTSHMRFGIVLLTPDDMGYANADGPDKVEPRARQNVVMEMGMLISALGRPNVAILKRGHLEVPSDASGIIYIPFNSHVKETMPKLCERLGHAGFQLGPTQITRASA